MDFDKNIQSQYLASLAMLRQVIVDCPDSLWNDTTYQNVFWHLAYHALYYTHLYLHPGLQAFVPWAKHRPELHRFSTAGEAYSRAEVLELYEIVCRDIPRLVTNASLEEPSGFDWLPFNRLETHIYNIRHLHQHVGELCERLGAQQSSAIRWTISG